MAASPHQRIIRYFLLVLTTLQSLTFAAETPLAEHLQKGLFEEEANHNLTAAIPEYEKIISESDQQRRIVATALIRLAECYRKLGKEDDARKTFERLNRDFSEFSTPELVLKFNPPGTNSPASPVRMQFGGPRTREFRELDRLLENSPDLLNGPGTNSLTYLQNAAAAGDIEMMQFLLQRGAKVDAHPEGHSPLEAAVSNGHKKGAEILIEAGAKATSTDAEGMTPMHFAAQRGYTEISDLLLRSGANVNAATPTGWTPLHAAAWSGRPDEIAFLVKHGANVNAARTDGMTPLSEAVGRNQLPALRALLEAGADANSPTNFPVIFFALQNLNILSVLLEHGANPNVVRGEHIPLLHLISESSESEKAALPLLLKYKADPNLAAQNGNTALHLAVALRNAKTVAMLLDAGANPNAQNEKRRTPLHYACGGPAADFPSAGAYNGHLIPDLQKIRLLLDHKADPNIIGDNDGMTPLQYAVLAQSIEVVQMLLQAGAAVSNAELKMSEKQNMRIYDLLQRAPTYQDRPTTR